MISVIRHHGAAGVFPLFFSEALLIGGAFYAVAWFLFPPDPTMYFLYDGGLERVSVALASLLAALYFFDLYSNIQVRSHLLLLQQLCQAVGVALLAQSILTYVFRDFTLPHEMMLAGSVLTIFALFLWRSIYSAVLLKAVGKETILFVGYNSTVQDVAREIAGDPSASYEAVGVLDDDPPPSPPPGLTLLGPLSKLRTAVAGSKPGRIVVGLPERRGHMPVSELLELRFAGCRIEEAGATYETVYGRLCCRDISPARVALLGELTRPANTRAIFRMVSTVEAAVLLVVLSPLLALTGLALRADGRGPALLRLPMSGRDGRVFHLYRFREPARGLALFRRMRLATLPALLNVLRGEMAMVGPRPAPPEDAARLSAELPLYDFRHNARPGITGWAQINPAGGETDAAVREMEYDLYYIKHMSHALNAYILLNTFKNRFLRYK